MSVYLIKYYNDTYDTLEQIFVFSTKEKALTELRRLRDRAKELGALEEAKVDNFGAPYVTVIAEDNCMYTFTLDPVACPVDVKF